MLLAIDLGSTWCKSGYYDEYGHLLASGRSYSRFGLGYGSSTDELERVWDALAMSVRSANENLIQAGQTLAKPSAIGLSCRGGTGVWLDRDWHVVDVPELANGGSGFAIDEIDEMYLSPVWGKEGPFAYSYAPATIGRLVWLRRHIPDAFERVARAGALHDWIIYRLTGEWVTDPASGTGGGSWPDSAIDLTGLSNSAFPTTVPQDRVVGGLSQDVAEKLGLATGTPVIVGCHDGVAANIGCNVVRDGDTCITLGSNLVVRAVTGSRLPECFGYPIVDGTWSWVRGVPGIASQVDEVVCVLDGVGLPVGPERHASLMAAAERVDPAEPKLRLPSLPRGSDRERARQANEALNAGYSPGEIYRATLEGTAYSVAGLIREARGDGADCQRFVVTGAAAGNTLLISILSAILDSPIEIGEKEAGMLGSAVLASIGARIYPDVDTAIARMVRPCPIVRPDSTHVRAYAARRADFSGPTGAAPGDGSRRRLFS